ncbi:hypothetical protein R1flu_017040 [Riccia fluitans]|uniref:Uncharacterized protein n=1 Tax=Riccia fluitans TaxID=41844 RepID=A0ABD1YPJ4_9MARC
MTAKAGILVTIEAVLNEKGGPSAAAAKAEPERRGGKWKQDTPMNPANKPKARRKQKTTKKPCETIELSDGSQEAKNSDTGGSGGWSVNEFVGDCTTPQQGEQERRIAEVTRGGEEGDFRQPTGRRRGYTVEDIVRSASDRG